MNFLEIARERQSCRAYDSARPGEAEKIKAILERAKVRAFSQTKGRKGGKSSLNGASFYEIARKLGGATLGRTPQGETATRHPAIRGYVSGASLGCCGTALWRQL